MHHRVVITGVGTVNPLGLSVSSSWNNLLLGHCGVKNILSSPEWSHLHHEIIKLPSHLAAPVTGIPFERDQARRMKLPRHFQFAEMAASETLKDSNLTTKEFENVGIFFGCGMPGVSEVFESTKSDFSKLSPYFIPAILGNSPAGHISRKFGLKGPVSSPSVACATGSYSIGEAYRFLQNGDDDCKAILAGACESPLNFPTFAGFSKLRALSTSNETPTTASKPFDSARNGFILGEGAGCLLLERLDSALIRAAPKIYAEVIGFGCISDAYHPTAPDPSNSGAIKAINMALNSSKTDFDLVAVNAHATSTQLGDEIELDALVKCCSDISVISNKGAMGHLLGASGAVESIFTGLSLKTGILPANLNLQNRISTKLNLPTINTSIPEKSNTSILKTSFGFGGVNVALHFKRYQG